MDKRPAEAGGTAIPQPAFRKLRILVADDNRDTVLTLMEILRLEGHEVHGVYKGSDVMRLARLYVLDAIVCDIELPEMSGYAIAQQVRSHCYPKRTPLLIAISGKWNSPSEKLLAQTVGFDHHLAKPCNPSTLIRLLQPLALPSGDDSAK